MGRLLRVETDLPSVMAATSRTPVGMNHLTVVPTNYDADAPDQERREPDRESRAADDE